MRQLSILCAASFGLFIFLSIGCATTKNASTIQNKLNGTWVPVKQEFGGALLPKAAFEKQKLIISDSLYTLVAESVDKGVVKYKNDKMDIYGKEGVNAGKHFTAIYKFENGELTVCYNLSGDSYPQAFETKSKPMLFLSVFKKEQVK
jgi:uncharacterized protein (TIGR03067 family)